ASSPPGGWDPAGAAVSAAARTRRMSSAPPPPGMCTSTRTTSGRAAAMPATASSTSPAVPTTSTRPSSSLRTPERTSGWSSTTNTLGGFTWPPCPVRCQPGSSRFLFHPGRGPRHGQLDLGAFAGDGVGAHPVAVLHVVELPAQEGGQGARGDGGCDRAAGTAKDGVGLPVAPAVEPGPQFPLLAAGQAPDGLVVPGPLLDESQ